MKRAIGSTLAAVGMAAAAALASAQPASADNKDGMCEYREFCSYYLMNLRGAMFDDADHHFPNYKDFTFVGDGSGSGQVVNDNTMSGHNRGPKASVRLYTDSWWRGSVFVIGPGETVNDFGQYNNKFSSMLWWF